MITTILIIVIIVIIIIIIIKLSIKLIIMKLITGSGDQNDCQTALLVIS